MKKLIGNKIFFNSLIYVFFSFMIQIIIISS